MTTISSNEPLIENKLIAFTFDDGPNTTTSHEVLDVLESYGVVATFFVIGQEITETTIPVMRRGHALGCEYANHSFSHPNMTELTDEALAKEVQTTSDRIEKAIGIKPNFFRPPYIAVNDALFSKIDFPFISGYGAMDWEDTVTSDDRIRMIMEHVHDGAIILLHDMKGNHQTVSAIRTLIPTLLNDGYEFVTVSQLF